MKVTLKVCVPELRFASAPRVALASDEVRCIVNEPPLAVGTMFQFASTPLTVTLKAVPAVRALGVPVFPVAEPGAAVSPGMSNCSFTNVPAFTATEALVLGAMPPLVTSLAVTVWAPEVLDVTLKVLVPATKAALAGSTALASLELIATVSFVLMTFQPASTALTVTLKAVPAVCAVGAPVLPVTVPGAAVSPGSKTCNWLKGPALTTTLLEVAEVNAPLVN